MFESLRGNTKFKMIVGNWLKSGRMPHAVIIEGDDGLGKHTAANLLAKALLCENQSTDSGCECRSCQLFSAGSHPDFKVISPNGKNIIPVDTIRELRLSAYEKPDRGGKKIYLIEAEAGMKTDSQNALLKILEEPPEYVVFIILAKSSAAFLDTIISRCVCLELSAPPTEEALEVLVAKLPQFTEEQLMSVLSFNDNNIGKSINQLSGDSGEIPKDAELIMKLTGEKKAYEALRVLSKYEKDAKSFGTILSLLEASAESELRYAAQGGNRTLGKDELLNLKAHIRKTRELMTGYVSQNLLITAFCAGLFEE